MRRIRTIIEEKMIRIESPKFDYLCQGGGGTIPGHLYYDEPWISDEHTEELLKLAKRSHLENVSPTSWIKEPELSIYWRIVCKKVEELHNDEMSKM